MSDPRIDEILARLNALEKAVAGIGHNGGPPLDDELPTPTHSDSRIANRRLSATQVAARYGVVVRTIDRWLNDHPELDFPQPEILNGRRYWWLSQLHIFDRANARKAANTKQKQGTAKTQAAPAE